MFVYELKIILNFRMSKNHLKKQAMSSAERK